MENDINRLVQTVMRDERHRKHLRMFCEAILFHDRVQLSETVGELEEVLDDDAMMSNEWVPYSVCLALINAYESGHVQAMMPVAFVITLTLALYTDSNDIPDSEKQALVEEALRLMTE